MILFSSIIKSKLGLSSIVLVLSSFYAYAQQFPVEKSQVKNTKSVTKSHNNKHIEISSPAFLSNGMIPPQYTCDGTNINPPLDIKNIPKNTKSLALIMDDPDARATAWVHWVVWNIPAGQYIKENSIPGIEGLNDFQQQHYGGPCPPSGTHRYFFKIYALDALLILPKNTEKLNLEKSMSNHIIGYGELIGLYKRKHK